LKKLFEARLIDQETYLKARNILIREHRIEESWGDN
ncbi:MAG: YqgQ family protein, partial [Tetragenococcus halophilus]|nr:YqgQ family protein [Tetragenococcus halophilus]